jgi:chromosome segregation ATPase
LSTEVANNAALQSSIDSLQLTLDTLQSQYDALNVEKQSIQTESAQLVTTLNIRISSLENERTSLLDQRDSLETTVLGLESQNQQLADDFELLSSCNEALDTIKMTFEDGHGEYQKQPVGGNCVRSTDAGLESENRSLL